MNPTMQAAAGALLAQGLGNNAANTALNASQTLTAPVSAFERPRPVILMGPNPLPVTIVAAPGMPASVVKPPPPDPAKTPGRSGPGLEWGAAMARVSSLLSNQFTALLSPLQRLATYLTPTASGFGVFQKAIQVFATAVAPVLLPAFVLLSVALLELSDVVWRELKPVLKDFYAYMLEVGLPAIKQFVEALAVLPSVPGKVADEFGRIWDDLTNFDVSKFVPDFFPNGTGGGNILSGIGDAVAAAVRDGTAAAGTYSFDPVPGGKPPAGDGAGKALQDVLRELQLAAGPKATFQGLGSVRGAGLAAAINFSPFEQRMLTLTQQAVQAMQEAAANTRKQPDAVSGWKK